MTFKPMLAATIKDVNTLTFPLLASVKLDGIRAMVIDGAVVSRTLKPIPNKHVQALFGKSEYNGFDGELVVGSPTDPEVFKSTTSGVMSVEGEPDVTFYVFDHFDMPGGYEARIQKALSRFSAKQGAALLEANQVQFLEDVTVTSLDELIAIEHSYVNHGYEGVMLRNPDAPYKCGRSTLREGALMKLKQFEDFEAVITGFEEQLQNTNEATTDALGHTKRSTHQANKLGKGTLGSLKVVGVGGKWDGVEFHVGAGFNDAVRAVIWTDQAGFLGLVVKLKYFDTGSDAKPRFPTFQGFRLD